MREILFRGKRKDNGEWIYGDLRQYSEKSKGVFDYATKHTIQVIPETIGQYTGLTDKNGKKIFEGDIVKYSLFNKFSDNDELENAEEKEEYIEKIKFNNGKFCPIPIRCDCEDYWYSWAFDNFEIIGNIHDNPELLKEREGK